MKKSELENLAFIFVFVQFCIPICAWITETYNNWTPMIICGIIVLASAPKAMKLGAGVMLHLFRGIPFEDE